MAFGMPSPVGLGVLLSWKDQMSPGMAKASRNLAKLKKQATAAAEKIERQAERLQQSMLRYQTGFRSSLRVAGAGLAIATPLLLATKASATFEDSMNDVVSLLVGTGMALQDAKRQVAGLKAEIFAFASKTRVPLSDVAASVYELVSALGIETAKGAFRSAANQAVAGKGTIEESTKVMTSVLATFGERWGDTMTEVEKSSSVFNIVSGTIAAFNTDLSRLSAGMAYGVGPANILGISLAEMTATIGMLQTKGLQDSMAGTAFAAGLRSLTQMTMKFGDATEKAKTEAMSMGDYLTQFDKERSGGKTSRRIRAAGKLRNLEITDDSGRLLPLWRIVENIERTFGITAEQATQAQEVIEKTGLTGAAAFQALGLSLTDATMLQASFGDEGSRMFSLLLGQSQALRRYTKQINESTAGLDMLAARQRGATARWGMMTNAVKVQIIRLGDHYLPMITKIVNGITNLTSSISRLSKAYPKTASFIAWGLAIGSVVLTVAGVVGALVFALKMLQTQMALVALLGGSSKALLGFGLAAKAASVATWLFNAALWANPITWIVVGVIALAAGLYLVIKHWKSISKAIVQAYDAFMIANKPMFDMFKNLWGGLVDWLKSTWDSFSRWITNSPIYLGLRSITEGLGGLLGIGGEEDGRRPTVTPATISPKVLPPTIRAVTDVALSKPEEIDTAGGVTGPALPSGGVPRDVTTNHFRITTQGPVDEKKLAREITKLQMLAKMRTVQGVN